MTGTEFKAARNVLGFNQIELSKELNIAQSTIVNYEKGYIDIPEKIENKIYDLLEDEPLYFNTDFWNMRYEKEISNEAIFTFLYLLTSPFSYKTRWKGEIPLTLFGPEEKTYRSLEELKNKGYLKAYFLLKDSVLVEINERENYVLTAIEYALLDKEE